MVPLVKYNAPKSTPEVVLDFTKYLTENFPLTRTKFLHWGVIQRERVGKNVIGLAAQMETGATLTWIRLDVALGFSTKPFDIYKVLHTAAHEYKHALQYDHMKPGTVENSTTEMRSCIEADAFATQVLPLFLASYNLPLTA